MGPHLLHGKPGLRQDHQPPDLRPPGRADLERHGLGGGETDADELYIAPTVLVDVPVDSQIMQEEVFGQILPVLKIDSVEKVIDWVNERTSSGDACVNDCAVPRLVQQLPFGGFGNSGMGKYHGHWGFEAFTNARGVLYHGALIDPGVKCPPYSAHKLARKVLRKMM